MNRAPHFAVPLLATIFLGSSANAHETEALSNCWQGSKIKICLDKDDTFGRQAVLFREHKIHCDQILNRDQIESHGLVVCDVHLGGPSQILIYSENGDQIAVDPLQYDFFPNGELAIFNGPPNYIISQRIGWGPVEFPFGSIARPGSATIYSAARNGHKVIYNGACDGDDHLLAGEYFTCADAIFKIDGQQVRKVASDCDSTYKEGDTLVCGGFIYNSTFNIRSRLESH